MRLTKLMKKLALPLMTVAIIGMLAACSSPASSGDNGNGGSNSNTPGNDTPLVSADEVTISATKIELSDGTWSYKEIRNDDEGKKTIKEKELTVSENGTVIVYTAIKSTHSGTIPEGTTAEQIAEAQAMGYIINGNSYTVVDIYTAEDIAKENQYAQYDFISSSKRSFSDIKTNSDKTKYSWTKTSTYDDGDTDTSKCYLVKTSSASSSGTNQNGTEEESSTTSTYKVIYDGITINDKLSENEFNTIKNTAFPANPNNIYYTQSEKTVTLTDAGFAMLVSTQQWMGIVVYDHKMIMPITAENMTLFASFTEGTDYIKTHNNLVYELTEAGYQKGGSMGL